MFNARDMVAQIREVEALGKDLLTVGKEPRLLALLSASTWPLPGHCCS